MTADNAQTLYFLISQRVLSLKVQKDTKIDAQYLEAINDVLSLLNEDREKIIESTAVLKNFKISTL